LDGCLDEGAHGFWRVNSSKPQEVTQAVFNEQVHAVGRNPCCMCMPSESTDVVCSTFCSHGCWPADAEPVMTAGVHRTKDLQRSWREEMSQRMQHALQVHADC
jgi:hypothetical protein